MAGFTDGIKKAWDYTIGGGYADDFVNSSIFPYKEFEDLAAIPTAKMTDAEKARYEALQPQISKSAEGIGGTLGVLTERGVQATAGVANEIANGAGRGLDTVIKEKTTFGKILGWLSNNWKVVAAAVVGVIGMFSGGIIGTVAVAGAGLMATDHFVKQGTGKSLLETFFTNKTPEVAIAKSDSVAIEKGIVKEVAISEPAVEKGVELAATSEANYNTNWAAQVGERKSAIIERAKPREAGFVNALVEGAKNFVGDDAPSSERFA